MSSIDPFKKSWRPSYIKIKLCIPLAAVWAFPAISSALTPLGSYFGMFLTNLVFSGERDYPVCAEMN
jgi:hypothetical protein